MKASDGEVYTVYNLSLIHIYLSSTLPLGCADLYWLRRWNCNVHNCL